MGINSYKLVLPKRYRLHPVVHCDLLSYATSLTSLRPRQAEIEGDHEEILNYIFLILRLILGQ